MKKLIFISVIALLVLYIYLITKDTKIYYLALGDDITLGRIYDDNSNQSFTKSIENLLKDNNLHEKTIDRFSVLNYRTTDLTNDIKTNRKEIIDNKVISIKNAIIKAELITISIGMNDFINYIEDYNLLRNNLINLKKDMEDLLKEIRLISKEPIILIGIYNPKANDNELNSILLELNYLYSNLANEYDIYYLDIYNEIAANDILLSRDNYNLLTTKLITYIESDIIN